MATSPASTQRVDAESFRTNSRLASALADEAAIAMGFTRPDSVEAFLAGYSGSDEHVIALKGIWAAKVANTHYDLFDHTSQIFKNIETEADAIAVWKRPLNNIPPRATTR